MCEYYYTLNISGTMKTIGVCAYIMCLSYIMLLYLAAIIGAGKSIFLTVIIETTIFQT